MLRLLLCVCFAITLFAGVGNPLAAEELRLDAPALMQMAVTRDVRLADDRKSIVLERGVLYEDDGPAAGYSYVPNEEKLVPEMRVRKQLLIADPRADRATLLVAPGGELNLSLNSQGQTLDAPQKAGQNWQAYLLGSSALRGGQNDFVFSGTGKFWIARDEDYAAGSRERTRHPNRSARSADGGKTWTDASLGAASNVDGEYYVRVFLDQHRPAGSVLLPVLDAGNLGRRPIAPAIASLGPIEIDVAANLPEETKAILSVRTGSIYVPDDKRWSAWQAMPALKATIGKPAGRFVQLRIELATRFPLASPAVKEVALSASPTIAPTWHDKVRIVESKNPQIVRTSIPFEYEPLDHPRLMRLRDEHKLDGVIAGAKDELETIAKLAVWSSKQWEKGHLAQSYPPWDALDILKLHADGKPVGGFCQQYNLVFLQACESFGLLGRAVSLGSGDHGLAIRGGHEVVEIWSNQFGKWMYIDGNAALYYVDAVSRVPLSLRELRERQLQVLRQQEPPPVELIVLAPTRYDVRGLASWPPFAELRLIPRSNFLAERSPLPLNQGMKGWFWTGHYVWTDETYPAALIYGNRVSQSHNWDWKLNQTHIRLEATATPAELRVWLDTETPSFESYLVEIDGGKAKQSPDNFVWKLHAGKNRLETRTRNIVGREGILSVMMLEYGN